MTTHQHADTGPPPGSVTRYLLLLGSNIDREHSLPAARAALAAEFELLATSRICDSAAVGAASTPRFHNQAAWIEVPQDLHHEAVRRKLRDIEARLGRVRTSDPNAPRTIDIDIVLAVTADGGVVDDIPVDPDLERLHHVAVPCADIAGDVVLPASGRTIGRAAAALPPPPPGFEILARPGEER